MEVVSVPGTMAEIFIMPVQGEHVHHWTPGPLDY